MTSLAASARSRPISGCLRILAACASLLPVGCGGDGGRPTCDVEQLYAPDVAFKVELWPDPLFLDADATSPSGYRVNLDPERATWVAESPPFLTWGIQDSAQLTGFARSAGAIFRFSAPIEGLPTTAEESLTSDGLAFYDLSTTPPTRIPYAVEVYLEGKAIRVEPLVPLAAGTDHLVVVTDGVSDGDGGCVSPSPLMASLLDGDAPDARFDLPVEMLRDALQAVGLDPLRVVAASAFRTHRGQDAVVDAADAVDLESYAFDAPPTCGADGDLILCDATFEAIDFRDDGLAVLTGVEQARYTIPVRMWIPTGGGPHPLVIFGHGLGGNRTDGEDAAQRLGALGIATAAIDALRHGDHPTAAGVMGNSDFAFLGLVGMSFDTLSLRGNFNQTYLDRLQLVRLLQQNTDIDGDTMADLDPGQLGYWGMSLGGLLGPGLLALEPSMDAAVLTVGGGLLARFVEDSDVIADYLPILQLLAGGADELSLYLAVAQSLVDDADPATWADAVHRRRLRGTVGPHLLLPTAESDTVVPPREGRGLARGLGAVQIRPVSTPTPPLAVVDAPLTATPGGDPIVGYFQFDRVGGDTPTPADHGMIGAPEVMLQAETFWSSWLAGTPEIIDPYPIVGTPPL